MRRLSAFVPALALSISTSWAAAASQRPALAFSGAWEGIGTYQAAQRLDACPKVEMRFVVAQDRFTFEGGQRVCGATTETFVPLTLILEEDGGLRYDGVLVGKASHGVVEVDFAMGPIFYTLRMRVQGSVLQYSEIVWDSGDSSKDPSASFTGTLRRGKTHP